RPCLREPWPARSCSAPPSPDSGQARRELSSPARRRLLERSAPVALSLAESGVVLKPRRWRASSAARQRPRPFAEVLCGEVPWEPQTSRGLRARRAPWRAPPKAGLSGSWPDSDLPDVRLRLPRSANAHSIRSMTRRRVRSKRDSPILRPAKASRVHRHPTERLWNRRPPMTDSALDELERRLGGRVYARQRLGIETDHEAQIFGQGLNFFHIENWYSIHSLIRTVLKLTGLYWRGHANAARVRVRHNDVRSMKVPP